MQLAQARYIVELVLLLIGCLGNLFIWFEADWFQNAPAYFGLLMSSLVMIATARPTFPAKYKTTARTVSFFFLLNFQEDAICGARNAFDDRPQGAFASDEQYRLARCGVFFALFSSYAIFFESVVLPQAKVGIEAISMPSIKSVRGLMSLAGVACFVLCQCIAWGIKDVCNPRSMVQQFVRPLNATPFTIALVVAMGVIKGDRELMDLGTYLSTWGFSQFVLIFNAQNATFAQDDFKHIWRAEMAFGFLACCLIVFGQLQHSFRFCRNVDVAVSARVKSPRFAALVALWVFAFAGAICVYVRVNDAPYTMAKGFNAWWATAAGFVIPMFCMAGYMAGAPAASIIAAFLTLFVQTNFAASISPGRSTTGYLRGGSILCMLTSFFMPLVVLSEKVEIAEDVEVYFQGDNKTPMWLCMLLGACGLLFWDDALVQYHSLWTPTLMLAFFLFFAASSGDVNQYKLVGYVLLHLLTMPMLWPPDATAFSATAPVIAFVIVAWAAAAYVTFAFPGACFDAFHEAEHIEMIEAETAFIDGKGGADTEDSSVAKMYKAGDSGAPPEKGSSITED